jgi:hypothetical protein
VRIVAVADTHLHTDDLVIPAGDVFVHAGDLCRRGTVDELVLAAAWIRGLPHRHKVVIAGNHDWAFARAPEKARELLGPNVIYLEDAGATIDGLRFWGSPWQPEFAGWAFNLPRGAPLAEKWASIPEGLDVLVSHGPPLGFGDRARASTPLGCADLLARVRQVRPRLHLFGHIHQDGGLWEDQGTVFANVTTWEDNRDPTVIDIDGRAVTPVVIPPADASRRSIRGR